MELLVKPEMLTSYMDLCLATLKQSLSICCTMFQLAGKVFTHKCDTGNLSALIQC